MPDFFSQQENPGKPVPPTNPISATSTTTPPALNGSPPKAPSRQTEKVPEPRTVQSGPVNNSVPENENPDDVEKEERRRAAQKVFGKQGYVGALVIFGLFILLSSAGSAIMSATALSNIKIPYIVLKLLASLFV